MGQLVLNLKRAAAFPPVRRVERDDYDVLADGVVVGRTMKSAAAPVGQPWLWTPGRKCRRHRYAKAVFRASGTE